MTASNDGCNARWVTDLMEREIAGIVQVEVVELIRQKMVSPRVELLEWEYGKSARIYHCWIVLEDPAIKWRICYCEQGFGPSYPWGIVGKKGMGPEGAWHASLEHAVRGWTGWRGENPEGYEVP